MIDTRMKIDTIKFGQFIAKRREELYGRHSQTFLAKKLNIAGPTLNNIENGSRGLSFGLFIDLADALQMTPGELMMVMAGREMGNKNYMEKNDWLYGRLLKIVDEYQALSKDDPVESLEAAAEEEADLLADITPDVESEQKSIEVINPDSTKNIV